MKAIWKLIRVVFYASLLPACYEVGTLWFYLFVMRSETLKSIHILAWNSGTGIVLLLISGCILGYGIYVILTPKKVSKDKTYKPCYDTCYDKEETPLD